MVIPIPPPSPAGIVLAHGDPILAVRERMTLWAGRKLEHEEVLYILKTIGREMLPALGLEKQCPTSRWFTD